MPLPRLLTTAATLLLTLGVGIAAPATAQDKAGEKQQETGKNSATSEPTAKQIVDASLDQNAMGFQSGHAALVLRIEDQRGSTRERSLDVRSKKQGELGRTLVTLTAPKEVEGQAFLFVEQTGEDDVWMYMPAFKATRRVEGGQKKGAFLGSHFTYADLESRDLKESDYKRLPDETIGAHPVYVVEATPKDPAASEYGKVVTYVRKSDSVPLKIKFFGKDGAPAKTLFVEKLETTAKGKTYAKQMTLRPQAGGSTTLQITALDGSVDLPDSLFSREQLGK